MKKTLLASAILAGLVSVSAQAATVYDQDGQTLKISGDIDVVALSSDSVDGTLASDSYASINAFASSKVSETVTAYAEFEIDTDADADLSVPGDSLFDIDELVVGFDTAYGDFSFGGTSSALGQISDMTDVAAATGGNQEVVSGGGSTGFAYANTFSGVSLNLEYIASDQKNEDSMGASALYSSDFGLDLGAGFVSVDEDNEIALGLGYSMDALYVGLGYAVGEQSGADITYMEVVAQYAATDSLTVGLQMGSGESEIGGVTTEEVDFYAVDATYALNSSVSTYASYKVANIDTDEDVIEIGLNYDY